MIRQRILQHAISMLALACLLALAAGSSGGGGEPGTTSSYPPPKQWYEGGDLHTATIAQWKSATSQNKLATSGDWLAATKWKGYLQSPDDFDKLKVKAQMLVKAVDKVVAGKTVESMRVSEIAAALVTMSNDFDP